MKLAGRLASAAAIALLLGSPSWPEPQEPIRVWDLHSEYEVEIDGAPSEGARLFTTTGRSWILLQAPELGRLLVLDLTGREVKMAETAALQPGPEADQVRLDDGAVHGPPLPYLLQDQAVVFYEGSRRIRITRKPPIVGPTSVPDLLVHSPVYRKGMEAYEPAAGDIYYLKTYEEPIWIDVYFGSWCPHCREMVPRFLKSVEAASNPRIRMTLTGVPTPPFIDYPPAKEKQVRGVPTFIVYAGDREIGRISAIPAGGSVEHELVKILYAHMQEKG